jgi:hypothetical protein
MRRGLVLSLAVIVTHTQSLQAEPAPGVNPARLQREDAERIDDQQRRLDHDPTVPAYDAARAAAAAAEVDSANAHRMRVASGVLFGVAGASLLAAGPLFAIWDERKPADRGSLGTWATVLAVSAGVTGAAGFTLFMASRHVRVAPVATGRELGLRVVGEL